MDIANIRPGLVWSFIFLWTACSLAAPVNSKSTVSRPTTKITPSIPTPSQTTTSTATPTTTSVANLSTLTPSSETTIVKSSVSSATASSSKSPSTAVVTKPPTSVSSASPSSSPVSVTRSTITWTSVAEASTSDGDASVPDKPADSEFTIWKGVSVGLGAFCLVVLLAFIMSIAVICRMRGSLKRVRNMLYPSDNDQHIYSELTSNGPDKKSVRKTETKAKVGLQTLKMSEIQESLDDEEIHSPMSPDPHPGVSPFVPARSQQTQQSSTNPLPKHGIDLTDNEDHIYENAAFMDGEVVDETDGNPTGSIPDMLQEPEYLDLNDEIHTVAAASDTSQVEFRRSKTQNANTEMIENIRRQSSMSGLPDVVMQRVNSQLGSDGMPFKDDDDDEFVRDMDSGIPMGTISTGLPDPQVTYQQEDTYDNISGVVTVNDTTAINPDFSSFDMMDEFGGQAVFYDNGDMIGGDMSRKDSKHNEIDNLEPKTDLNQNPVALDLIPTYEEMPQCMSVQQQMEDELDLYENGDDYYQQDCVVNNQIPTEDQTPEDINEQTEPVYDNTHDAIVNDECPAPLQPQLTTTLVSPLIPDMVEVNGRPPFNAVNPFTASPNSIAEPLADQDPLGIFKNSTFRLRSDSSSTPDNYYLDMEDVTPELNVEVSKKVSAQFPSDFYIRGNFEGLLSQNEPNPVNNSADNAFAVSANPFVDAGSIDTNQTDAPPGETRVVHEIESTVYSNLILNNSESFGTESST